MNPDQVSDIIVELGKYILGSLIGGSTTYYLGLKFVSKHYTNNSIVKHEYIKKSEVETHGDNSPAFNIIGDNYGNLGTPIQATSQPTVITPTPNRLEFDRDRHELTKDIESYVNKSIQTMYEEGITNINLGGSRAAAASFHGVFTPVLLKMQEQNNLTSLELKHLLNNIELSITKDDLIALENLLFKFFKNYAF